MNVGDVLEASSPSPSGETQVPKGAIYLGHNTFYVKALHGDTWMGIIEFHHEPSRDGSWEWSGGSVPFEESGSKTTWEVESYDPLTLSPSIACKCGHHGWIRNGEWVPA